MKILTGKWSAYLTGSLFVFFFLLGLYLLDSPLGMSDAYIMVSDYCGEVIEEAGINSAPPLDLETGFLFGILAGACIAAAVDNKWKFIFFPEDRKEKSLLHSSWITPLQGICGGFLVMLGLQLAGDSFLGHWAAAMQLSTGSWLFLATMFISGVICTVFVNAASSSKEEG